MIMIEDKVQFAPFKECTGFASNDQRDKTVIGTVVMVNYGNGWFSVEFECDGAKLLTSYKFSQIGKDVLICGK